MRLITRNRTRLLASEHGFSMIVVMGVMAASALFVAAAFAAANGDLPLTRDSQDRKQAYVAAEAGINYYQYHLNQDPDYWTKCTTVPAPNGAEKQPVNLQWNGTGTDPRRWRDVAYQPGKSGIGPQYTIELLPANGNPNCTVGNQATMIDQATGSFRIRATGRPRERSKTKRSVIAQFRRRSFLDFLYFTEYETKDPAGYSSTWQTWAATNCGDKPRSQRATTGGPNGGCDEIQFADFDAIKGPFHTNDDILTCGTPEFGRSPGADSIEFSGPAPGYKKLGGSCPSGSPVFNGPVRANVKPLNMPPTNQTLLTVAGQGAVSGVYTGETWIRFNTDGTMTVKNEALGGTCRISNGQPGCTRTMPTNGVIYVQTPTTGANCGSTPPQDIGTDYTTRNACGNLYVSGTYNKSLTLAAQNDIIVRPWSSTSSNGDLKRDTSSDAVMGLIAQNFVRIYHPCPESSALMKAVQIDAAILSIDHSFTVDNYDCGSQLDNLTVNGAIAQKYRGPVGTTGGTGFKKAYQYDDRLRYRSPPYFLEPVAASWHVIRSNEQVPPR
jgi:Tfp pilus assembly protein PilX